MITRADLRGEMLPIRCKAAETTRLMQGDEEVVACLGVRDALPNDCESCPACVCNLTEE